MTPEDEGQVESERVDVRCRECRIHGSANSFSLLRALGWRQRDEGTWVCPRCLGKLAQAS